MNNSSNREFNKLKVCYRAFVDRAMDQYGFAIHHAKIEKRKESIMCVETGKGKYKDVPVLEVSFREETFKKVVDERGLITKEVSDLLKAELGKRPENIYPSDRGFNIVYETVDYTLLGIGFKSKRLEKAIYERAQDYVEKKYREIMDSEFHVKILASEHARI